VHRTCGHVNEISGRCPDGRQLFNISKLLFCFCPIPGPPHEREQLLSAREALCTVSTEKGGQPATCAEALAPQPAPQPAPQHAPQPPRRPAPQPEPVATPAAVDESALRPGGGDGPIIEEIDTSRAQSRAAPAPVPRLDPAPRQDPAAPRDES